jgi:hypothetical protein
METNEEFIQEESSKFREFSAGINFFESNRYITPKIKGKIKYIVVDLPEYSMTSFRLYPENLPEYEILNIQNQSGRKVYPVKINNCDPKGEPLYIQTTHYDYPEVMDRLIFEVDNPPIDEILLTIRYEVL